MNVTTTVTYTQRHDFRNIPGMEDSGHAGPVLLVGLANPGTDDIVTMTNAVVDTGAHLSLFKFEWAELLDFDLAAGEPVTWQPVVGQQIDGYVHPVTLFVDDCPIECKIGFVTIPGLSRDLLGREGFLDRLELGVQGPESALLLNPAPIR